MQDVLEKAPDTLTMTAPVAPPAAWRPATRVAFRFCATYFTLYILSTQMIYGLLSLPSLVAFPPLTTLVTWVATRLFGFGAPLVIFSGSGDKPFDWALAASLLVIAAVVAALWSLLDRARTDYVPLHAWTYTFVRLAVGATMIGYGMTKVIPMQMPFPNLTRLLEPYGHFSLMGVLWSQIGSSPAFERFTGVVELTAGILLFIPRLSLLAATLSLLASTFIFTLNMTYDVPVKLLSLHLVLMSLFLLAPHRSRLLNLFVLNRATEPRLEPPLVESRKRRRALLGAQIAVGAWVVGGSLAGSLIGNASYGPAAPRPPLYGIWEIELMAIDGQIRVPLTTDAERWRRAVVPAANTLSFQRMDDTFVAYRTAIGATANSLALSKAPPVGVPRGTAGEKTGELSFQQSGADRLVLDGTVEGKRIRMELRRVDHTAFRLLQSEFRWVQDYPYNR
jgi:hypothetical protein